jgi:hypothetical protein
VNEISDSSRVARLCLTLDSHPVAGTRLDMATGNPETVVNGDPLDVFTKTASSSSGSDLSDELGQLKLNDDAGSGGSAALEKSDNPWTRSGEEKDCHAQNGTDSAQSFAPYGSRQLDGFVGSVRASYNRTPWSTESNASYVPRPPAPAQSLLAPNMPWIEAHEAWVNATKRSRASAMATSQYATAALQRRARFASLPVDSPNCAYNFFQKSRRVASPVDPFDHAMYGGDPASDYFGIGPMSDAQNDVFLPIPLSQRPSRAAQLYGKGFTTVSVLPLPLRITVFRCSSSSSLLCVGETNVCFILL